MDILKFYAALTNEEKKHLHFLLNEEQVKSVNCTLSNWADKNYFEGNISVRCYNALKEGIRRIWGENILLSELTFEMFVKVRNAGKKSWDEIVETRGY